MMWFIEGLKNLITFPAKWFWKHRKEYTKWQQILLLAGTASGILLIIGSIIWLILYLGSNYPAYLVIIAFVIGVFSLAKYEMEKKETENAQQSSEQTMMYAQEQYQMQMQMQDQAVRAYPVIRKIMYQTLKSVAESVGGNVPRLLTEIEVPEGHFICVNSICFYQFKLAKADIRMSYMREELQEFERILQTAISRKIQAGEFPTLGTGTFLDAYGNVLDAVIIDIIEDMDTYLIIQAVFYSPAYAEYWRQKQINQQSVYSGAVIPEERWDNRV
ncbi:MAG: hypothetical protein J1F42_10855 [Lachnospiraceae bacterium]|nr:hypothetical protein [Lachnospiraceae bacterium]